MDPEHVRQRHKGIVQFAGAVRTFLSSDAFQTAALVLLVAASLGLSSVVWMGSSFPLIRPEPAAGLPVQQMSHREVDWKELLAPASAVVHLSGKDHFLLGCGDSALGRIWSGGALMSNLWELRTGTQQDVKSDAIQFDSPGVTICFAMPWTWGGTAVESMTITGGKSPSVLVKKADGPGEWVRFPLKALPDYLEAFLRDFDQKTAVRAVELPSSFGQAKVERGIFVPVQPTDMIRYAGEYDLQGNEALAAFFVDSAMLRRVMERDGAVIFTDGQRGLRVYPTGEIEFTWPQSDEGEGPFEQSKALEDAVRFTAQHGGVPAQTRFLSVKETASSAAGGGYHVELVYYVDGYPVVRYGGGAIQLDVGKSGVKRFFRGVRKPSRVVDTQQIEISWRDAVAIAVGSWAPGNKGVTVIRRVYRCYLDAESLRPAWAVETYGGVIAVDAVTGKVAML